MAIETTFDCHSPTNIDFFLQTMTKSFPNIDQFFWGGNLKF
jgi:hypothetical protein